MKILVIDDEKPTLSMFNLFLRAYGYEVSVAENGEKGLHLFKTGRPDIVFTDIKMPGMDGLEVLKRIRETDSRTQVIVITGHGDMEKALDALDLDASDFINKPVERRALDTALARAEKRRQMPGPADFKLSSQARGSRLHLTLAGRMTGRSAGVFQAAVNTAAKEKKETVRFILDDNFSINRSGISLLMTSLRALNRENAALHIENLSYTYARVFQMAGMDKLAVLTEAVRHD